MNDVLILVYIIYVVLTNTKRHVIIIKNIIYDVREESIEPQMRKNLSMPHWNRSKRAKQNKSLLTNPPIYAIIRIIDSANDFADMNKGDHYEM